MKRRRHNTTTSEMGDQLSCNQLHFLRWGLKLAPNRSTMPLTFGKIWHEAMEVWWELFDCELRGEFALISPHSEAARIRVMRTIERANEHFDEHEATLDDWSAEWHSRADKAEITKMRSLMKRMIVGYEKKWGREDVGKLLLNETTMCTPVITPSGHKSPWSGVAIRKDKLIELPNGARWIVDHKTSGSLLSDWRSTNGYSPQAATYAWAYQQITGVAPDGICYDLVYKAATPLLTQFKTVKSGRLSYQLPAHTTPERYKEALEMNGESPENDHNIATKLAGLYAKDWENFFFRRVYVRFTQAQLDRVEREIYMTATQIRRGLETIGDYIESIAQALAEDNEHAAKRAAYLAIKHRQNDFRRNAKACKRYGRRCAYSDLCEYGSIEALDEMKFWSYHVDENGLSMYGHAFEKAKNTA